MPGEALTRADALHARSQRYRDLVSRTYADLAEQIVQAARPYVALSGGKDSLVAWAIASEIKPGIPAIWCDDELEYDGTLELVRTLAGDRLVHVSGFAEHAQWFRPWRSEPFWREPDPAMIWTGARVEEWAPAQGYDAAITGVRGSESRMRRLYAQPRGMVYERVDKTLVYQPIIRWSIDDVWAFIAVEGLPYHPVYDILSAARVRRDKQRIGPLPLSPRWILSLVDVTLPRRLEDRYGHQW